MLNNIIAIKDDEFLELRDIIYTNSSIAILDNKRYLLENRLSIRLHDLNFRTFKDYIYYLKYDLNRKRELETMINLITINETYFLREKPQMEHLVEQVMPELISSGRKEIKIWSAACSTGEEPYSLAILLMEAGLYDKACISITATDINTEVINTARRGIYKDLAFRGAPPSFMDTYFDHQEQYYHLKPDIKSKVKFTVGNLTGGGSNLLLGKFDVIFCRNVLIYFDMDGKRKVIDMFQNSLNTPGYLYLGHSETMFKLSDRFEYQNFGQGLVYLKMR